MINDKNIYSLDNSPKSFVKTSSQFHFTETESVE